MKEGWEYKTLGEVCEILDSRRKPITKNKRESGIIPYYGATGLLDYVKDFIFDEKLVLLGEDGAKWGAGEISAYIIEGKSWVNNHAHALRPKRNLLKDELLVYYLNFSNLLPYITGVTVPKLNHEKMRSIEIPIGPIIEQQSIVDYLDSAFAKIDAMKANAEKSLNEAKALFQASLKEMLEPKEGWEEKTLDDVCEIKSILVDPKEVQYKNLLHVGGANIVSETGELIDLKTAAEEELSSGKFTFNDKDVLYNKIRPYLIKVSRPGFSGLCSADMYPLTSKKGMTRDYLYYILVSRDFTDYAIMNSARAGMPKLNRQTLFAYKCMIPPLSEQQSIVETLDSLKSKVDRLQENYDKISQECDALKQAILRKVFE